MNHFKASLFSPELRRVFEASVAPTLALNIERDNKSGYISPKTGNLFIAFCYGWYRSQGACMSLPEIIAEAKAAEANKSTDAP